MLLWSLLFGFMTSICIWWDLKRTATHNVDVIFFIIAVLVVIDAYSASPWRKIKQIKIQYPMAFAEPSIDLSSPYALAKGIASSGGTFVIARVADATGFGVFMASAKALGALGISFTGIHQSMFVLGLLLHPAVYITFSLSVGLVTVLSNIKTGDQFLKKAVAAVYYKEWQKAYDFARQASNKSGVLRVNQERVDDWYYYLERLIDVRVQELEQLSKLYDRIMANPGLFGFIGFLSGAGFSIIFAWLALMRGANCVSIETTVFAITFIVSERFYSVPMARILSKTPMLQMELNALLQIQSVEFPDTKISKPRTSPPTIPKMPIDWHGLFKTLDDSVVAEIFVILFCAALLWYVLVWM